LQTWDALARESQHRLSTALAPGDGPDCVVYPTTPVAIGETLACAHRNNWPVLPYGNGSKLSWGGLAAGIRIALSTQKLAQVIDHAVGDLTITVEAGARFRQVEDRLAGAGQTLGIDPAYADIATIGGIVATADTGSLRQCYGSVRDRVLGISFLRSDGQVAKAGGRVVKNVAGYDLMKLFTGSYGTLGILSQITLRVYPLPDASQSVLLSGTPGAIASAAKTLRSSSLTPAAVDVLSPQLLHALELEPEMGLLVRFQSIPESVAVQCQQLLQMGESLSLRAATFDGADEDNLWRSLRTTLQLETVPPPETLETLLTCKLGVLPSEAIALVAELDRRASAPVIAQIHVNTGIGWACFQAQSVTPESLLELRQFCGDRGGYLSVVQAPLALKKDFDIWDYAESSLGLMQAIARQFDPKGLLSPGRSIGG
jgi:glycolate oxidase FAD binding subunit